MTHLWEDISCLSLESFVCQNAPWKKKQFNTIVEWDKKRNTVTTKWDERMTGHQCHSRMPFNWVERAHYQHQGFEKCNEVPMLHQLRRLRDLANGLTFWPNNREENPSHLQRNTNMTPKRVFQCSRGPLDQLSTQRPTEIMGQFLKLSLS